MIRHFHFTGRLAARFRLPLSAVKNPHIQTGLGAKVHKERHILPRPNPLAVPCAKRAEIRPLPSISRPGEKAGSAIQVPRAHRCPVADPHTLRTREPCAARTPSFLNHPLFVVFLTSSSSYVVCPNSTDSGTLSPCHPDRQRLQSRKPITKPST